MGNRIKTYRSLGYWGRRYWRVVGIGVLLLIGQILWLRAVEHPWEGITAKHLERGDALAVSDYVQIYFYWGGVIAAIVLAVLLVTSRWWWRWTCGDVSEGTRRGLRPGTWGWVGLLCLMAIALELRAPQMGRPVYRDEQDNLRRSIHGYHELDGKTGEPVFRETTWQDAFFENRFANNPILFSILAKLGLDTWRALSGAPREFFSVRVLRLPSLLAGLASIVALWGFLYLLRAPTAAFMAGLLAAVHPIHVEYSIQARGYGILMWGAVMAAIFAVNALRRGRWKDWIGFGASLFVSLYAYAGAIYFVLALGGAVGLTALCMKRPGAKRRLARLAIVGLIAGTLYYQMIAPSLPQIHAHLSNKYEQIPLSPSWLFHTATAYAGGTMFLGDWREGPEAPERTVREYVRTQLYPRELTFMLLAFGLVPLFALFGVVRFFRMGAPERAVACGAMLAPALDYCHHQYITHLYAYYWYWIYSLPFLIALIGTGIAAPARWLRRGEAGGLPVTSAAFAALFFSMFLWETSPNKLGRMSRIGPASAPIVHQRGSSNWVVYAEGRMLRQPVEDEVAETFPW